MSDHDEAEIPGIAGAIAEIEKRNGVREHSETGWDDKTFSHYFDLLESKVCLCGSGSWNGERLGQAPTKPKCPICLALLNNKGQS